MNWPAMRTGIAASVLMALQALACHAPAIAGQGAKAAAAASDGGPRRWQVAYGGDVQLRTAPAGDAKVIARVKHGAVLANLGCKAGASATWCHVQPLRSRTRGYVMAKALRPAQGPDGTVPVGTGTSAQRARKGEFDATGSAQCAQIRGQALSPCTFAVARDDGGDAAVVVTFSNGFKRTLYFAHGMFIRANTTMSGVGYDTDWRKTGGLHVIRVEDQRYELPDAIIFDK